jgi:hypothetical protein
MGLIGTIEKELPASRISSLTMKKGNSRNDVRVAMTVDIPLINEEAEPAKKPN